MNALSPDRVEKLVAEITRYLAANPKASDTVVGIQQSWLAGVDATPLEVSAALEHLVRLGRVERVSQSSVTVFRAH